MSDGFGDRLLMFDNTAASSLELLRFRPDLLAVSGFEDALRDRVEELIGFQHSAFSRIHALKYLDGDRELALVSTHTPGKRLSEMIEGPQRRGPLHPAFAVWMIRQLTPALSSLHARGAGIVHGALSGERIVLTPDGKVVIVEYVLGSAIGRLQLHPERMWTEFGIVVPPSLNGTFRVDVRSDIIQLGLVALSAVLGRRITPDEYPARLNFLLSEFSDIATRRAPALVPQLRLWLQLALQAEGGGFASALEAHMSLRNLAAPDQSDATGARLSDSRISDLRLSDSRQTPALTLVSETPMNDPAFTPPHEPSADTDILTGEPKTQSQGVLLNYPTPEQRVPRGEAVDTIQIPVTPAARPSRAKPTVNAWNVAIAFAVLALVEAVTIGGLLVTRAKTPGTPPTVPITVNSPTPGDVVMVDGKEAGVTPLTLNLGASTRSIGVISQARFGPAPVPDVLPAGTTSRAPDPIETRAKAEAQAAANIAQAAAKQNSGGLRLNSPIELAVLEGERVLGSSADGPIVTTAGTHQLDFVNTAVGYRQRQTVQIKAGQIVSVSVTPPPGRISINAAPWAQVWIDGNPVGETPLANLTVALGQHEIVFRHPQLGEHRETAIVKAGTLTRVSASLGK